MNIITIIAKITGAALLLLSVSFLLSGRIWLKRITYLFNPKLSWETFENIDEILVNWFEQPTVFKYPPTSQLSKIAVFIIHKAIIRTFNAISISRDYFWQNVKQRLEFDNFHNRIMDAMRITIFRCCILPFIVGVGLILSGSLWWTLILPLAWIPTFQPFFQANTFSLIIVILSGWIYGGLTFSYFSTNQKLWYGTGNAMGVVVMFIARILIEILIWSPYFRERYTSQLEYN